MPRACLCPASCPANGRGSTRHAPRETTLHERPRSPPRPRPVPHHRHGIWPLRFALLPVVLTCQPAPVELTWHRPKRCHLAAVSTSRRQRSDPALGSMRRFDSRPAINAAYVALPATRQLLLLHLTNDMWNQRQRLPESVRTQEGTPQCSGTAIHVVRSNLHPHPAVGRGCASPPPNRVIRSAASTSATASWL